MMSRCDDARFFIDLVSFALSNKSHGARSNTRSGCDPQPRVAAAATLGIEFQSGSTPMGLRPLSLLYTQRSRRAATLGCRSKPLRGIKLARYFLVAVFVGWPLTTLKYPRSFAFITSAAAIGAADFEP